MKPKLIDETQIKMLKPNQLKKLNQTTQTDEKNNLLKLNRTN